MIIDHIGDYKKSKFLLQGLAVDAAPSPILSIDKS